ncbi:MAG: hypothetical protein LBJ46_01450 [Planctomycetota bacterium]|jgi:hypothetical protein|nr:hypothetical protein [Planctomycetota bacterium]
MPSVARIVVLILLFCLPWGGRLTAAGEFTSTTGRERLARRLLVHDFENHRDPDTGLPSPLSADLDVDGWPDFWEPVRAVGFPEYLVSSIAIVRDPSPFVAGAYRDVDNHALHMAFDGTRVGIRTSVPVPVDPGLAYEFSLRARDSGLEGTRIRAGVEWMRIDPVSTTSLRRDEIPDFLPGQTDWPAVPLSILVSEPPRTANAARLFVILEGDPDRARLARHGSLWLDDIRLRQLPNIRVEAARDESGTFRVFVAYSGLTDNIPDPDNPGFHRGRRYSRRVEITDVLGRPMETRVPVDMELTPNEDFASEEIPFPSDRFGVYYLDLRLYDADGRIVAGMTRSAAVIRENTLAPSGAPRSGGTVFGVTAGSVPEEILRRRGLLERIVVGAGARMAKITPWPDNLAAGDGPDRHFDMLTEELRRLRSAGIMTTGLIAPPSGPFPAADLATVLEENGERFGALVRAAGRRLGMHMDGWQWGADGDASLAGTSGAEENVAALKAIVDEFSNGLPMIWNTAPGRIESGGAASPEAFGVANLFHPANESTARLWFNAGPAFPWLYSRFFRERGQIYPPPELTRLAPPPPVDRIEEAARERNRRGAWITLEPAKTDSLEPNAATELRQLEEMLVRIVRAAALAPNALFVGDIFDAERGHIRTGSQYRDFSLETLARPTYLALKTVADLLEGAEYLGPMKLLKPYEAHVFRRPGSDDAVIALWHVDPEGERALDRSEIANGPPLHLVDWAGNRTALPPSIPVFRTPSFIVGLPASLALTRMSVRIAPDPPMRATNRRQPQILEAANHFSAQAPLRFRLRYAARATDGGMEGGWTNSPADLAANMPPGKNPPESTLIRFFASPDPNSPVQEIRNGVSDSFGTKIVQARMAVNSSPPADMTLYLDFRLRSDLDVEIRELPRIDDPNFRTIQMRIRWFPDEGERRRQSIDLRPFYLKRGDMREPSPLPVRVRASNADSRGDPEAPYEAVELRIPRLPARQTWVGLNEDGGGRFHLADVTEIMNAGGM